MTTMTGNDRRAQRRNRRSVDELGDEGRERLRRLLAGARLAVLPTSEAIPRVEARLAPGTVPLAVVCTDGLGIDQTLAVSEVLAARGYQVTPHLAARQIRSDRHLDEILLRLARRDIRRVFVVRGRAARTGPFASSRRLLAAIAAHRYRPVEIGIAGYPDGHGQVDRDSLTADLLTRAPYASFVSTQVSLDPARLLAWVAEMRVRGLELPIEAGVPGVVSVEHLAERGAGTRAVTSWRRRGAGWFDPTGLLADLAAQPTLERLHLSGLRVETLNEIEATAAWRQQIYDLAHQARTASP